MNERSFILIGLLLAGCGSSGGGGSGGGNTSAATIPGPTPPASGFTPHHQAPWKAALASLGAAPKIPLTVDAAAIDRWNELIATSWPLARHEAARQMELQVRQRLAAAFAPGQVITISNLRNVTIDLPAPPMLTGGGAGTQLSFGLDAPASGTWRIAMTADVLASITINIAGIPITPSLAIDITVDVSDLKMSGRMAIDATDPARPLAVGAAGPPAVDFRLTISSQDPWIGQLLAPLTAALDPVLRAALSAGSVFIYAFGGGVISGAVPAQPWGTPAASPAPMPPGTVPLLTAADALSDEIQRLHMPHDIILPAVFDQDGFGNGNHVGYADYGDSCDWTGHYLSAESYRYELTGDARALARAEQAARGLSACLEVEGSGLLSRCVVPMSSPYIRDIQGHSDYFVGSVGGVPTGATGDVSRDSYIGSCLGMTQAYLRVPTLRARAAAFLSGNVAYLEAHDWNAFMPRSQALSRASPFSQTPGVILALVKGANLVDPARFGALHGRVNDLASILWINNWTSSRDVRDAYYKFQLAADEAFICATVETDPAIYRHYIQNLVIVDDAIGFHDNAYFDAVYGAVIPAAAPGKGPRVEDALLRTTVRDRRGHTVTNSNDPSIARAGNWALHPIPVEKRISGDFVWIQNPFTVDAWADARKQYTGLDILLPYWLGRSYGLLR